MFRLKKWIDYLWIENVIESNQCRGDRRTLKSNYRVGTLHKSIIINPIIITLQPDRINYRVAVLLGLFSYFEKNLSKYHRVTIIRLQPAKNSNIGV